MVKRRPFNDYFSKWEESGILKANKQFPLAISFELFHGCNLACGSCLYSIDESRWGYEVDREAVLTFDVYKKVINEGASNNLLSVKIHGLNEPLLKPDMVVEFVKYASEMGIPDVSVSTNGILLTPELSKRLVDAGLTQILISLDALYPETYIAARGSNYLPTIMNNIEMLKKYRRDYTGFGWKGGITYKQLPLIKVSFVKTKNNIKEAEEFEKYWKTRVDGVMMQYFVNLFLDEEKRQEVEKIRLPFSLEEFHTMPYKGASVRNNGDVVACCLPWNFAYPVGNIYKQSMKEIWKGELYEAARKREPKFCDRCKNEVFLDETK